MEYKHMNIQDHNDTIVLSGYVWRRVNKHWRGSNIILAYYWARAEEVPLSAVHAMFLLQNINQAGYYTHCVGRHVIMNYACRLPVLVPRLCLLPPYTHTKYTI
jgi:hypothetical protein